LLKSFKPEPQFLARYDKNDKDVLPMRLYATRIVEVPINSAAPKPYILHNSKNFEGLTTETFELAINIEFHNVVDFFSALRDLYSLYQ
jgi:hypothetical protein